MMRIILTGLLLILLSSCSTAQGGYYSTKNKKAIKYMKQADECLAVSASKMYPDVDCAIEKILKATESDPNFTEAWIRLGDIYSNLKRDKNIPYKTLQKL